MLVGLDLSLTSPALAVHDTTTSTWHLFAFAQRVREEGVCIHDKNVCITLLPAIPKTGCNEARYEHIRHHLVDAVLQPLCAAAPTVRVAIESYAFGATHSGHAYKLMELGGIVKHSLFRQFPHWTVQAVPPTKWKKHTVGTGRASKAEVVTYVQHHGPCVPLLELLGLVPSSTGTIPCPVQDLADAVCLVLSLT